MRISEPEYRGLIAVLDDFSKFLQSQKGMYTDACAGFAENKRLIETQKARVNRATMLKMDGYGKPVMMFTSLEDPSSPDAIHYRIIKADDYIAANSKDGSHEQQHARAILVFIFTYWEEEIRPKMADALKIDVSEIKSDVMGDLRIIRNALLHSKAILKKEEHRRLKALKDMFFSEEKIILTQEKMHKIFQLISRDCMKLLAHHTGTDAPIDLEDITHFAVQRFDRHE